MADQKATALTGFTPVLTDILYGVDDPGGTPVSGKVTFQQAMDLFEANMTVPSSVSAAYLTSTILASTSNTEGAALIGVEDAGTYFTGADVEAVLAEIGALLPAEANADVTDETNVLAALSGATTTEVDPAATDKILILDASDSDNIKNITWSDVTGLATAWDDPIDASITVDTDSTYDLGTTSARIANGFFDQVYASGALVMTEVADNPVTPTAGIGQLWTSDDTTQKLMFTDDAGTDKEVAFVTGGTDLSAYTGVLGLNSGTAVDVNTKALLEARLSDVSDLAEADGDVWTGVHDFGGATSLEIPNSATPTVDAAGEIAIDTTVTDWSHGILEYFSGETMGVVAMPIAQFTSPTGGYVVAYNATNDEFELVSQAGGGDMSASTYDPGAVGEQLVGLTASQTLTNKQLTAPQFNTSFTFDAVTFTGVTGADTDVVSGTAGSNGYLVMWNGDGDAVDSTVAASDVVTLTGTETLTNKTLTDPKVSHSYNAQTGTSYTLVLGDANKVVSMSNASANTLTIPPNSSVAFPTGTIITVFALGAGTTTIAGGTGVTLSGNGGSGSAYSADIQTQYNAATIIKIGTDSWLISGDIDAVAA